MKQINSWLAASCWSISLIVAVFSTVDIVFYLASFLSLLVIGFASYSVVKNIDDVPSSALFAISILMFYGLGTCSTIFNLYLDDINIFQAVGARVEDVNFGLSTIYLVAGSLFFASKYMSMPFYGDPVRHLYSTNKSDYIFGYLIVIFNLWSIATGKTSVQGVAADELTGSISPIASIASGLLVPGLVLAMFGLISSKYKEKIPFLILVVISVVLLAISGRRVLIFGVLVAGLFSLSQFPSLRNLSTKRVLLLLVAILFLYIGYRFFFALRLASWSLGSQAPFMSILNVAIDIVLNSRQYGFDEQLRDNEIYRTFVLDYHSLILARTDQYGLMWGALMVFNFLIAVPSIFYAGKSQVTALFADEAILHPHLGLPVWDGANSAMTTGYADFGIVGLVAYPIMVVFLYNIVCKYLVSGSDFRRQLMISSLFLNQLIGVETAFSGYFTALRDCFIYVVIYFVFYGVAKRLGGVVK